MRNDDNYYGYHNDYDSGMLYLMEQPALRPLGDAPVWLKHALLMLGGKLLQWVLATVLMFASIIAMGSVLLFALGALGINQAVQQRKCGAWGGGADCGVVYQHAADGFFGGLCGNRGRRGGRRRIRVQAAVCRLWRTIWAVGQTGFVLDAGGVCAGHAAGHRQAGQLAVGFPADGIAVFAVQLDGAALDYAARRVALGCHLDEPGRQPEKHRAAGGLCGGDAVACVWRLDGRHDGVRFVCPGWVQLGFLLLMLIFYTALFTVFPIISYVSYRNIWTSALLK